MDVREAGVVSPRESYQALGERKAMIILRLVISHVFLLLMIILKRTRMEREEIEEFCAHDH